MARFPTFPTLYDKVLQIHLSGLKQMGYLDLNTSRNGTLIWGNQHERAASISILSNMKIVAPYIELNYQYEGENICYKVELVSIPSNLGKGKVWYFLCPVTKKRCRILYLIQGYFLHREAFGGCMYSKQTSSKIWRQIEKEIYSFFMIEKLYHELDRKYFKTHYAGKPTKRYLKIIKRVDKTQNHLTMVNEWLLKKS